MVPLLRVDRVETTVVDQPPSFRTPPESPKSQHRAGQITLLTGKPLGFRFLKLGVKLGQESGVDEGLGVVEAMKSRSHRPPVPAMPMDHWEDGSWTVDCSCGVTFDDGEEMVDCDDCGVWVHTRCSRFVKGAESFTCEKCEGKNRRESPSADRVVGLSATDNEETEVAQLLAELPNKADPCQPSLRGRVRKEERVHVHGVPGGVPALFEGISSVIASPKIWNCTGYVPKKFNFKYKEFPCWDGDDNENPANTGANLLFSLSKDAAPCVAAELVPGKPPFVGTKERDSKFLWYNGDQSSEKKEKNKLRSRPYTGKEVGLKKKGMPCVKKTVIDSKKRGIPSIDACALGKEDNLQGTAPESQSLKSEDKRVEVSSERAANSCLQGSFSGKSPERRLPTITKNHVQAQVPVKLEIHDDQDHVNSVSIEYANKELSSDVDRLIQFSNGSNHMRNLNEGSFSAAEEPGNPKHATIELGCVPEFPATCASVSLCKLSQDPTETEIKEETSLVLNKPIANSAMVLAVGTNDKLNSEKSSNQHEKLEILSSDFPQVQETASRPKSDVFVAHRSSIDCSVLSNGRPNSNMSLESCDQTLASHSSKDHLRDETVIESLCSAEKLRDTKREPELRHHICDNLLEGSTSIPCSYKLKESGKEAEGPSELHLLQKESSECNPAKLVMKNTTYCTSDEHEVLASAGKPPATSSLQGSTSLLYAGSYKSPTSTLSATSSKNVPFAKRVKLNAGSDGNSEISVGTHSDVSKHSEVRVRGLGPSGDESSRSETFHVPPSKFRMKNPKENVLCSSAKASSSEHPTNPSGSGKPAGNGSLKSQSASTIKLRASGSSHKNERIISFSSQTSNKMSNHSTTMHPPSSINASATLSDEELAKRLHQELNSSPRVSRLPRGLKTAGIQLTSNGTSILSKRSSSSGGKLQVLVSRRKNRDDACDLSDRAEKVDDISFSSKRHQTSVSIGEHAKADSLKRLPDDSFPLEEKLQLVSGTDDCSGLAPHTLPGLVDEIMSKKKDLSYEEVCDAVLPHWQNLRKANGERYPYSTHMIAVLDCLKNKSEWAHLVDHGGKSNSTKKKRKPNSDSAIDDSDDGTSKIKISKEIGCRNDESCRDDYPKGKRKARKRRRLSLQGRVLLEFRKGKIEDASSNDDISSISRSGNEECQSDSSGYQIGDGKPHVISETSASISDDSD